MQFIFIVVVAAFQNAMTVFKIEIGDLALMAHLHCKVNKHDR